MSDLTNKKCIPCEIGTPPMEDDKADQLLGQTPGWGREENYIKRDFVFADFNESMKFINKVAAVAESEGHHPDIYIFYNKVTLKLMTHAAKGLTENDFIVAAKINQLFPQDK
jgi:4a-hydroxytetrahydrobiopterin dehydratase